MKTWKDMLKEHHEQQLIKHLLHDDDRNFW